MSGQFYTSIGGLICILLLPFISYNQAITTPGGPSPAATLTQTIGISTVTVNYSRPSVKGREVWGTLVPYGWNMQAFGTGNEAPWRAGANQNTTIRFSHDVTVEGKRVTAGTYGLFFVTNKNNTGEVVLSKDSRSWGSFFYDATRDELRANIITQVIPFTELLTYDFDNITKTSAVLGLSWEKKLFPVKIEFDVDKIVMANAIEELKGPIGFTWQGFSSAANYALQNKVNLPQALTWIDKAILQNKGFATLSIKSGILKELNHREDAEKIMSEAIAISTENELNGYGYQLLNSGKHDQAIEMFILNTRRFLQSANTWDSLGEGYFTKGDKQNAIANFKKSLSLNPPENVKINSEKFLKQMNVL